MAIDQKVTVPRVLILADTRFDDWSISQTGNMAAEIGSQFLNGRSIYHAAAAIRIEGRTMPVESDLEAPTLDVGYGIGNVRTGVVQPNRHLRWTKEIASRWGPQKEDLLPRGKYAVSEQMRK